ncbi:hypothetical protein Sjap_023431 [Stephania japonica]|uniref:Uncharacterized protein n=1 Tax=Stephania japonica TaxID=461633 RepID=A0AAP0HKG6_9MAGN
MSFKLLDIKNREAMNEPPNCRANENPKHLQQAQQHDCPKNHNSIKTPQSNHQNTKNITQFQFLPCPPFAQLGCPISLSFVVAIVESFGLESALAIVRFGG